MRDGAHVRAPVDSLIRQRLQEAGLRHSVIGGEGSSSQSCCAVCGGTCASRWRNCGAVDATYTLALDLREM